MFIVILGMQGSGKGTQSKLIADKLGIEHVSTGEMLRAIAQKNTDLGRRIKQLIEAGTYLSDHDMTEILKESLPHDCILDGYPRTLNQARILDSLVNVDMVLNLELGEEEAMKRMSKRGRSDDTPDAIRKRIEQYHAEADKIAEYYTKQGKLRSVNGEQSVEQVFEAICEELGL